jgi:uncharacterized protein YoxC
VNDVNWPLIFLGIIAAATLVMAVIQVGAAIALMRVAAQAQSTLSMVQRDVQPVIAKANELAAKANDLAGEASKTMTLATVQAEKIDRLVTDLTKRIDDTSAVVQQAIVTPAREGLAIVSGIKAALGALRRSDFRGRAGRHADEEDPLFIG